MLLPVTGAEIGKLKTAIMNVRNARPSTVKGVDNLPSWNGPWGRLSARAGPQSAVSRAINGMAYEMSVKCQIQVQTGVRGEIDDVQNPSVATATTVSKPDVVMKYTVVKAIWTVAVRQRAWTGAPPASLNLVNTMGRPPSRAKAEMTLPASAARPTEALKLITPTPDTSTVVATRECVQSRST